MNIAFRLDATKRTGVGHLSRCKNLAYFLSKRGAKIFFIVRDLDKNFKNLLIDNKFKINFLPNNNKFEETKKNTDMLWPDNLQKIDAVETKKILKKSIDWLIVDHYGLNKKWEKEVQKKVKKIMVISDFLNRKHHCDLFIFQNEVNKNNLSFKRNFPKKCKFLIGSNYALIDQKLIILRNKIKKKNKRIKKILINFGSINPSNLVSKILNAFEHKLLKKYNLTVLGATANINFKKKVKFFSYKRNFVKKLNKFDFCIGSGGVANLERMCIGLPSLIFPISSNQIKIVKILEKKKLCLLVKDTNINVNNLRNKIISTLKNKELINTFRNNSFYSVDGYGVFRVVEILYPMGISKLKLRNSKNKDLVTYYKWVNDEQVIKSSFKNKRIKFKEHLKWFQKKIKSKKTKMFILESGSLPIGQIRFDLKKNKTAKIDYSLDSIVRNRGWGKKLINLGIKKIYKTGVRKISADVRHENTKSIAIFKKLGFLENKFKLKNLYTLSK